MKPSPEYLKFLSRYGARITRLALAARALVLAEAPDAIELIYDAYNAVAAGYSFTGRPSDAFIHIAAYAGWVNLGFNWGSELDDPDAVLQGSGRRVRHIRISETEDLKKPSVRRFVKAAAARAQRPNPGMQPEGRSIVHTIYARKRRPARRAVRPPTRPAARSKDPRLE